MQKSKILCANIGLHLRKEKEILAQRRMKRQITRLNHKGKSFSRDGTIRKFNEKKKVNVSSIFRTSRIKHKSVPVDL